MRIQQILFALLVAAPLAVEAYDFYGKSFFSVRVPFQSGSPEKEALWHYDFLDECDEGITGSVEVVPFGGQSTGDGLGIYFSPCGKSCLNVLEYKQSDPFSTTDLQQNKDLEARHFNIQTAGQDSFRSIININPVHSYFGLGVAWRQRFYKTWWFGIEAPIMRVENEVQVCEDIKNNGGGAAEGVDGLQGLPREGNMIDALCSPLMQFGRIEPNVKHSKWGLADLELKLGWESFNSGDAHLRSFVGAVVPTGNKPDPTLMFPPVVGNNQHWGVIFGSNLGFIVWENNNHRLRQEFDNVWKYLFANEQERAFDVCDKQWSRYQEVYANEDEALGAKAEANPNSGHSGINLFTACATVEPRFSSVFNTAMIYTYCDYFMVEAGYNFFARQGENVCFQGDDPEFSFKHVEGEGKVTKSRTIQYNFKNDVLGEYQPIALRFINEDTAAHPPAISNTLYGAVGLMSDEWWCMPTRISIGGSYEWSHGNGALKRWMAWGKVSVDF